jgi:beta-lactamase regulating signal transducer with metallopeptidase domain
MHPSNLQSLAELSAGCLLNSMAEGIGIALFAWVLLRITRQNSGTRFAVLFLALLTIAALPILGSLHPAVVTIASHSELKIPSSWALYLIAVWLVISGISLGRVVLGFWQLQRLRQSCVAIDLNTLDPVFRKSLEQCSSRPVTLCLSDEVRVPTAIGFSKALVVIPRWAMEKLSSAELNTVLLHELAHVRRWDDWTNLAQRILGALLFFHPAVWWIQKRLSLEREMACDDFVLAHSLNRRKYAECLVLLAENSYFRRSAALAQAAVSQLRQISLRLAQILDKDRSRARVWKPALGLFSGFTVVALAISPFAPRLIGFADPPTTLASSGSVNSQLANANSTLNSGRNAYARPAQFTALQQSRPPRLAVAENGSERKAGLIAIKVVDGSLKRPVLIKARAADRAKVSPTLLLVVQTEAFGTSESSSWNLLLWRVVLLSPQPNSVQKEVVAKVI